MEEFFQQADEEIARNLPLSTAPTGRDVVGIAKVRC